jgi:DNA-binding transcriptional LysR family regulator
MLAIIAAFESQHQGCTVETVEFPFGDRLRPLRAGELDLIATRIPLEQPDLVVGPTLSRDRRVLAVASDHPLAGRKRVSIEEVADYEVARLASLPKELSAALVPARTPTGRLIRRRREEVRDLSELLTLVARGKLVHPTVAPFGEYFAHAGIVYVPIADMPPSSSALVWRRRDPNPRLRAFVRTAKDVLRSRRGSASP